VKDEKEVKKQSEREEKNKKKIKEV